MLIKSFSVEKDQPNVATLLSIPLLLKQIIQHTIPVKGVKKPWNPLRTEISSDFLSLVPSISDRETNGSKRETKLTEKTYRSFHASYALVGMILYNTI